MYCKYIYVTPYHIYIYICIEREREMDENLGKRRVRIKG